MGWIDRCFQVMDEEMMFESSGHRTRFWELLECYGRYSFFTRGLCKCMYLAAWDEEHFAVMLETLAGMVLAKEQDTEEMRLSGELMAEDDDSPDQVVYRLSAGFLQGRVEMPDHPEELPLELQYLLGRALMASNLIDSVPGDIPAC
ncbi:MAG TPA: hypothetical protein IAC37_09410 [Candidatus Ventrimonas merdavium]|nr:hypothetical protein [Candidatus Ventrimonas merdavium]